LRGGGPLLAHRARCRRHDGWPGPRAATRLPRKSAAASSSARSRLDADVVLVEVDRLVACSNLASTGYALANSGQEYLVLQPRGATEPFTVEVAAGAYAVEWYGVDCRETVRAGTVNAESDGRISFTPPVTATGPSVLYLKRVGR
jgi:hypothetical protein